MRKRFEQQLALGQKPINQTLIRLKEKNSLMELLAALKAIFVNPSYNEQVFSLLEEVFKGKNMRTGRTGMDLWSIFVLSQVRLCLNISYDQLLNLANDHYTLRHLMGVEYEFGYERIEFEYQNIYDNVSQLDNQTVMRLNAIIVEFGHDVFKKKEEAALLLKSDSFVVGSNVHFPTDYNLLWDCIRKCLDIIQTFVKKYAINQWRKLDNWRQECKGLMREVGKASNSGGKNKEIRVKESVQNYLEKALALLAKLQKTIDQLPINDMADITSIQALEQFILLMDKHIDLLHRRVINGEQIPHSEKMFSIFEQYTEMIKKGKLHPNVELGKKLAITTDQFDLIVDYQIMEHEQDREIVLKVADRVLAQHKVESWSFDKGFWNKDNKTILKLEVPTVVMPKLGKLNEKETQEEHAPRFKRLKNKHSAIESNINELEHRGLDRCPDRGYEHYKRYIGLGVCAYNLKKIGRELLKKERARTLAITYKQAA
jgi:hypothetical protein